MKDTALATLEDSGYEILDYFYTTGAFEVKSNTFKSKFAFLPRKLLYAINKDLAVKIFGGFSLLVLAK
ncbi:MAG: hypothetical protein H0X63_08375 [Flavobacteriales bacterium]|jgi:hypothetical protein|nr:hypothetical protein [Flavobacteriales bacterium]